ncbi:DegT/DnrJ/EryC1/StrS family aminotransferase [Bradyrhizobium sp. LB14.3]
MGLLLGLKALGIKPRQEVMASSCSFLKTVHAINLADAPAGVC